MVPKGSIASHDALEDVHHGKVIRPLRSVNPDQDEYCGLIQAKDEEGVGKRERGSCSSAIFFLSNDDQLSVIGHYEFGIASLMNKKDLLQVGDPIQFQVSKRERNFAVNIKCTKEKQRACVEAMKGDELIITDEAKTPFSTRLSIAGQFGFLSFEAEEGKKLFFHTTEVENNEVLQQGDEVEFVLVTNKRSGKHSACCVRKISSSKRPERLISKLKTMNLEDAARAGKKIVVIRQPKGPEGRGFKLERRA